VLLQVRDTGTGMTPAVIARAFEPFFTTKARGHGTGLGLATVHGIVHQNNGEVTIKSIIGQGTAVLVVLPTTKRSAPLAAITTKSLGGNERILLVEDEAPLRVATARLLASKGYQVLVAGDGVEALEVLDRADGRIDVVVTDLAMPRMGGTELARLLDIRDATLPVILLSGYDSGEAGSNVRVLAKPVSEERLLVALREVFDV
jgi:CheY-like chemotaxis protein